MEAVRTLRQLLFSPVRLKAEAYRELVLLATGSAQEANQAWTRYVDSQLAAGETPE